MKETTFSDYIISDKKIERKHKKIGASKDNPNVVRVAFLGSFTLNGIKEVLNVKCDEAGLALKSYVGRYNQYNQELLDGKGDFYKFNPHLTIFFVDLRDLLDEDYHFPYKLSVAGRKRLVRTKIEHIKGLVDAFKKRSSGKLLLNNFSVPTHSTMGILENRQEFGFFEMIHSLNRALEATYRNDPRVYIFDYDGFLGSLGKASALDEPMYYLADMKLNKDYIPGLCGEYMRYIKAIKGRSKKCIVVDLDNTLWGGIVGEDGFDGIKLGPTPPGNAFVDFQKYLLSLWGRGIMLAINSNNNPADALSVIREHPYMVLKEDSFASIKINWGNKANNLADIAKEMNIGLDSLIYIDDDKRNRQLVREMMPQVLVLDLPEDPARYSRALKECTDLDTLSVTEEDSRRGAMYAEERKRKETRLLFDDITGFLAHLDISVSIKRADKFSTPRISQLAHRTNQFNMTTRRYAEEDIRSMSGKNNWIVCGVSVKDKFGDSGLSGAVMLRKDGDALVFDNFLLSCRVLGKGIEKAVMAFCVEKARDAGLRSLICEFISTEKNEIARAFLDSSGFRLFKRKGNSEFWKLDTVKRFEKPDYIKVIKE